MGMQLSLLNYTLSEGLIKKYKGQKISIFYLKVSLVSFLLGVLIPWIESSLMLFNDEVSGVVFLSLIVMLLVMVVIVLIFTLVFLLFIGKNKNEH